MDYNALIQNRRSARQFTNEKVTDAVCAELESYYRGGCQKLVPQISTELRFSVLRKSTLSTAATRFSEAHSSSMVKRKSHHSSR